MAATHVNPTRMELTRLKRKLQTALRGHKLLKDKRDELMRQFLELVRENKALREKTEKALHSANQNFMLARAGMQEEALNTAMLAPKQEIQIETGVRNVMSVEVPKFPFHTRTPQQGDMFSYGFAFTSGDLDGAVEALAAFGQFLAASPWNAAAVLLAMGAAFFALSWLLLRRAMIRPAK